MTEGIRITKASAYFPKGLYPGLKVTVMQHPQLKGEIVELILAFGSARARVRVTAGPRLGDVIEVGTNLLRKRD